MFYLWVSADDAARGYAAAIIARAGAIVGAAGDIVVGPFDSFDDARAYRAAREGWS